MTVKASVFHPASQNISIQTAEDLLHRIMGLSECEVEKKDQTIISRLTNCCQRRQLISLRMDSYVNRYDTDFSKKSYPRGKCLAPCVLLPNVILTRDPQKKLEGVSLSLQQLKGGGGVNPDTSLGAKITVSNMTHLILFIHCRIWSSSHVKF